MKNKQRAFNGVWYWKNKGEFEFADLLMSLWPIEIVLEYKEWEANHE